MEIDKSHFYVDFSDRDDLSNDEKAALEMIQASLRPIERVDVLLQYVIDGKISPEQFETMTGLSYCFQDSILE